MVLNQISKNYNQNSEETCYSSHSVSYVVATVECGEEYYFNYKQAAVESITRGQNVAP